MPTLSDALMPHLRRAALSRDAADLTDSQLLGAFLADGDAVAFDRLVRRHAPMVFGVCRRVIGHAHSAEDAFQAVFVVLARKAATVRPRNQLANWLFGVAYRTALKARGLLARRWSREKQVAAMPDVPEPAADLWGDIQPVLDEELAALPDHLRVPVVLCDLEGRTQREAARQLDLPLGTLANRLAAARRRLAGRLGARGVALSGGLFATVLGANVGRAAVPAGACAAAARAGLSAIGAAAGAVPESVLQLSEGVLRMMLVAKLKVVTAVVLAGLALLGGFGLGTLPAALAQGPPAPAAKPALGPNLSDAEFLRKTCEALRGSPATTAEIGYFVADADANKRKKVVTWLTEATTAENIDTYIHRRLHLNDVPMNDHRLWLDMTRTPDGIAIADIDSDGTPDLVVPKRLAFTPDGKKLAAEADERVVVWTFIDTDEPKKEDGKIIVFESDGIPNVRQVPQRKLEQRWTARVDTLQNNSDAAFLNKATTEARGNAATKLEREYFLADKDPKKREKLLDLLLSDPAVAKKVGPEWKKNMLAPPLTIAFTVKYDGQNWSKLIGELIAAKKTDEQVLEALTLAIAGRLPTEVEKKLVAGQLAKEKDRLTAWAGVAGTLAGTDEAKAHAETLKPANQVRYRALVSPLPTDPLAKPPEPKK